MRRWRARAYLVIFAALAVAAGIIAPLIGQRDGLRLMAGVAIIGGLAMLVVAVTGSDGKDE